MYVLFFSLNVLREIGRTRLRERVRVRESERERERWRSYGARTMSNVTCHGHRHGKMVTVMSLCAQHLIIGHFQTVPPHGALHSVGWSQSRGQGTAELVHSASSSTQTIQILNRALIPTGAPCPVPSRPAFARGTPVVFSRCSGPLGPLQLRPLHP